MIAINPPDYVKYDFPTEDGWEEQVFTMPENMEGNDLPTLLSIEENTVVSFWKLNDLEREAISKGHVVCLRVIGSQPPVSINVI